MKRIVVIGAGAAGLTAGWRLARWGYSVIVLEKRAQLGGALAELAENALRFPAAAPTLKQLMRTGVLSLQPLRSLPFTWGMTPERSSGQSPQPVGPKSRERPFPTPSFGFGGCGRGGVAIRIRRLMPGSVSPLRPRRSALRSHNWLPNGVESQSQP
ncbi:FAD-dependent oxidoreductase [Hydrogenophilus thermoluteolus]|uniref:FAD-dependent oxidoreductase n=1 Tax=Hydrogenophilus thermoluteolus TaxID=297 RepID=UPI003F679542